MLRASVTGLQLVASSRATGFSINSAGIQEQRCQGAEGCASAQLCRSLPGVQVARVQAPDTCTPDVQLPACTGGDVEPHTLQQRLTCQSH